MRFAFNLGLGFFCSVAITAPVIAQPSINIYTCIDSEGRKLTADRPIPQCADREQRVLSPSGVERHRLGPALTETEMAQRLEQRRTEELVQQRLQDQRRRDAALLARYPLQTVHDGVRQKALVQVDEGCLAAKQQLQDLTLRMDGLQRELNGYSNPMNVPEQLRSAVLDVERQQQEQRAILSAQEEEARRIHQRFDRELQRLQILWASQEKNPKQEN